MDRQQRSSAGSTTRVASRDAHTTYRSVEVEGLQIFYREAGPRDAPHVLLLHGFPTSSHMFRNLIPALADRFHVIAPDYPGFGNSSAPASGEFEYTFERLTDVMDCFATGLGLERFAMYLQDYGAPIGFRLAVRHPGRIGALVIQNGNAYDEGLGEFWRPLQAYWRDPSDSHREALTNFVRPEATKWLYTHGVRQLERISPDNWRIDQALLDRPGNQAIQLQLFQSYGSNPALYPQWQEYFRRHQPPTLVVWGQNDQVFAPEGAHQYKRDLEHLEFHLLDTGHFALEEEGDTIAELMRRFLERWL